MQLLFNIFQINCSCYEQHGIKCNGKTAKHLTFIPTSGTFHISHAFLCPSDTPVHSNLLSLLSLPCISISIHFFPSVSKISKCVITWSRLRLLVLYFSCLAPWVWCPGPASSTCPGGRAYEQRDVECWGRSPRSESSSMGWGRQRNLRR